MEGSPQRVWVWFDRGQTVPAAGEARMFELLWSKVLTKYDVIRGIGWKWQALDWSTVKSPLGGQ